MSAVVIDGGISVVIGVYLALFGFGVVGDGLAEVARQKWGTERAKSYRKLCRFLGPIVIGGGLLASMAGRTPKSVDVQTMITDIKAKIALPLQVDDNTRLDDVRAVSNKEIGYFLTLTTATKTQLSDTLAEQLENNLRGGACQNPAYVELFKAGFSLRVAYQTMDQAEVVQVVLVPGDCGF